METSNNQNKILNLYLHVCAKQYNLEYNEIKYTEFLFL